ncbi:hypothetical protein WM40_00850 [Robbsia andropogonis]|uniref:Uncharacterized protein n=1 Tax=Robbsia andropogonis TaxID=28092 RepID=A0A0F5K5U1_9BURK|nr:type III secretion system translocon subunit SctB [Robbsia andropogonis]KKB65219.1 hypothetical protein WM40_00850 [Robbsia andropogonis]
MVDGIRGDGAGITQSVVNEGATNTAGASLAKPGAAGALSSQTSTPVTADHPGLAFDAAAKAPGAPMPLPVPDADALSKPRVGQAMTAIMGGGDDGGAAAVSEIDINQLMLMMFEMSRSLRDTAMKQRAMSQEANIASQSAAINAMRDAAAQRLASAIIDGVSQCAMGALALAQAAGTAKASFAAETAKVEYAGAKELSKQGNAAAPGIGPMRPTPADVRAVGARFAEAKVAANTLAARNDGYQKMGAAIGKATSAVTTSFADEASITQRRHELDASRHDTATNSAAEMAGVMRDRANETLQTLRAIHQSLADASNAITRNL